MPATKRPAGGLNQPAAHPPHDRRHENQREGVGHVVLHAGLEDRHHFRGQAAAQAVGAERAERDGEKRGDRAEQKKRPSMANHS